MATYARNGQPIPYGAVTLGTGDGAVQYPVQILDLWSDADLAAIGITREPSPPAPAEEGQ